MLSAGFIALLLVISTSNVQGTAVEYSCTLGKVTAYTPSGTFYLSSTDSLPPQGTCTLLLPRSLFRSSRSKLKIIIENFSSVGSCSAENLIIVKDYRYCTLPPEREIQKEVKDIDFTTEQVSYFSNNPHTDSTFRIRYVIYEEICDSVEAIVATPFVIHHSNKMAVSDCTLRLNVSEWQSLSISALSFDNESNICPYSDQIVVRTGTSVDLCQGQQCLITGQFNVTSVDAVLFSTSLQFTCGLFWEIVAQSLSVEMDVCSQTGNDLVLSHGSITSPGYPQGSTGPFNCTISIWQFEVVAITIKYYKLRRLPCKTPANGNPCSCSDRLVINGTASCGPIRDANEKSYVTEKPLSIQFITGGDLNTNEGFYLKYTGYTASTDICSNSSLELSSPLVIKSPEFPSIYPGGCNCKIVIDVSSVNKVVIKFLVFNLAEEGVNSNCQYDYLSINGNRSCGHRSGEVVKVDLSSVDRLVLFFKSDATSNQSGFYLSIEESISMPATTTAVSTSMSRSTASVTTLHPAATSRQASHSATQPTARLDPEEEEIDFYTDAIPTVTQATLANFSTPNNREINLTTTEEAAESFHGANETSPPNSCQVPWYYWVISLIAVLLAVLITITFFLIKLKRLKDIKCNTHADTESSRDGLSNPAYYNTSPRYNGSPLLSNAFFSLRDMPASKRVYINKNSVQTTV